MKSFAREVIHSILDGKIRNRADLNKAKSGLAYKYGISDMPRNSDILAFAKKQEQNKVLSVLQKKPTRTISGVAIVAAMTKPTKCPHGRCIYCPGGVEDDVPQSYTGKEPSTRRAIMYNFDPYKIVTARLYQLHRIGHPVDKCELILMGGTQLSQEAKYQDWYVSGCLAAMNDFEKNLPKMEKKGADEFLDSIKYKGASLEPLKKKNEKALVRCIGMTFESRPDWAKEKDVDRILNYGGTRIELGVQTLSDEIYKKVKRGHTVKDVVDSTQICKDSLLKVGYHMMPGLFADVKEDLKTFKDLYKKQEFMPDMLKIYPCLVLKGTKLYDMWKRGDYEPYTTEDAVELISKVKRFLPKWTRVVRIQRDIPVDLVEAGVVKSNLRQLVEERMKKDGTRCRCIRCREVGLGMMKGAKVDERSIELLREDYKASGGKEIFLSFEDTTNDLLIGFLRLRFLSNPHRKELHEAAGIRELHVYGPMVEIGEKAMEKWQHRGYGKELLKEAENIANENGYDKIVVISAIGAKEYYRKFGYKDDGPYMRKRL